MISSDSGVDLPSLSSCSIAIIGLGYVGLPLATELAKVDTCRKTGAVLNRTIIGFDISTSRINELLSHFDRTNQVPPNDLQYLSSHLLTSDPLALSQADIFIVTVPTPIDNT